MTPKYLEAFRRAARESQTREKSEVSEKSLPNSCGAQPEGYLTSLTSLISHPEPSQEAGAAVCAQCGDGGDLWHLDTPTGPVLVHEECARFLQGTSPAPLSAPSSEPGGVTAEVQIYELPPAGRYRKVFLHLQLRPPAHIPEDRWRRAIEDGKVFLHQWGSQAEALGWTSADLLGLHRPPEQPGPSYDRLSRYDCLGLIWALQGRKVVAITADSATIKTKRGTLNFYRHSRPGYGPVGDSLEDFTSGPIGYKPTTG